MLDFTPDEWRQRLTRAHDAELGELRALNDLYEMRQPLSYMHPELIRELDGRIQQLVLNWPGLIVDALDERIDLTGFRFEDQGEADGELWDMWQANNLDAGSQQAHLDAMVMRRSFQLLGTREGGGLPLITVESPLQVCGDWDPQTRELRAILKRWQEHDPATGVLREQFASLRLPGVTHWFEMTGRAGWVEVDRDEHGVEVPLGVALVNRQRTLLPGGKSELDAIKPISDAACKAATDMMLSVEHHAMPRRWALGFDEDDFVDANGNPVSAWKRLAGRLWASSKTRKEDGAELGQFPEADLSNFHDTIDLLARLAAAQGAVPPNYLGLAADDAASADAIRSREARLVKRAERRERAWSNSYEQMMRIALRIRDGDWDPRAHRLETLWRDPATPTRAQAADATVKLVTAKIIPVEQGREDLGYTAVQRERMQRMDREGATRALDRLGLGMERGLDAAAFTGPKARQAPELTDA